MTRLAAGILALLVRGPYTVLDLAIALNENTLAVRRTLERLETDGIVEHTTDGWRLTSKVAA